MRNVLILSGYGATVLRPFGESIKDILLHSLHDIGVYAQHKYCDKVKPVEAVNDTLVIFMVQPEMLKTARALVDGNNNKYIWLMMNQKKL